MRLDKNQKNTRMTFVVADATYDATLSSPLGKRASHGRLKTVISAVPAPKAIRAINHACCTSSINSHAVTVLYTMSCGHHIYNKEWLVQDSNVIGPRFRRKLTPNSLQAFARFNALGEG